MLTTGKKRNCKPSRQRRRLTPCICVHMPTLPLWWKTSRFRFVDDQEHGSTEPYRRANGHHWYVQAAAACLDFGSAGTTCEVGEWACLHADVNGLHLIYSTFEGAVRCHGPRATKHSSALRNTEQVPVLTIMLY